MNGARSRFNESPRWSSTGNKESVRRKRSRKLEVRKVDRRERERKEKKRKERRKRKNEKTRKKNRGREGERQNWPIIQRLRVMSSQMLTTYEGMIQIRQEVCMVKSR